MLSYRHAFHAGNHADILKHCTLTLILGSLLKKEKPFTLFDTHGGAGIYQLDFEGLLHTGEAQSGILKLLDYAKKNPPPAALESYLRLAEKYVASGLYPGSPEISRALMRSQDKLFVAELHNTEIDVLRGNMAGKNSLFRRDHQQGPSLTIRHENGFSLLASSLPPKVKRGLILMDPSYETASDYQDPIRTLGQAARKWETAVIALWYPLLSHRRQELDNMLCQVEEEFSLACKHNGDRRVITAELKLSEPPESSAELESTSFRQGTPSRLYGSGMMILNSPYQLDQQLREVLPYLQEALAPQTGSWEVREWK